MPYINGLKDYQRAMVAFCIAQSPEFFVTLTYHRDSGVNIVRAQDQLHYFHAQIDRRLAGKRWHRLPMAERTRFISIPEGHARHAGSHLIDGLHYHLLLSAPPRVRSRIDEDGLQKLAAKIWGDLVPSGKVVVERVASAEGVSCYVSKRFAGADLLGREYFTVEPRKCDSALAQLQAKSTPPQRCNVERRQHGRGGVVIGRAEEATNDSRSSSQPAVTLEGARAQGAETGNAFPAAFDRKCCHLKKRVSR